MKQPIYTLGSGDPRSFAGRSDQQVAQPTKYPGIGHLKHQLGKRIDHVAGVLARAFPSEDLKLPEGAPPQKPPFHRSYCSFTPMDLKLFLDGKCIPSATGFALSMYQGGNASGTINLVMFDRSVAEELMEKRFERLTVLAADEHGQRARMTFFGVQFTSVTWRGDIDEVVMGEDAYFSAEEYIPLRRVEAVRDTKTGDLIEDERPSTDEISVWLDPIP